MLTEPGDPDGVGRRALRAVRHLIRCDVAALNDVDPDAGRLLYAMDPPDFPTPAGAEAVLVELAEEHPLLAYVQRTGDGSARRISDVTTPAEFRSSALYRRLYGPMGVEHQMSVTLPVPLPAVVAFALSRAEEDFTDRERLLLELLRPHLSHAWRQAREHARLVALLAASTPVTPDAPRMDGATGTLALALADPVVELTDGALVELYRFFGRPSPRSALPARVERWLVAPPTTGSHTSAATPARSLLGRVGHRHALLRRLPAGPDHPQVLLIDTDVDVGPTLTSVGLTVREVEVVALLATGATNEEIADDLHVAPGTVKKHLDHVYAKLGVRGRLQAVTAALELDAHERNRPG